MGLTPFQISSASWLELEGTFSIFTSRPGLPRGASTRVRIPRTSGNNTTRPNTLLPLPLTSLYTFSRSILVLWRQVLRQITTDAARSWSSTIEPWISTPLRSGFLRSTSQIHGLYVLLRSSISRIVERKKTGPTVSFTQERETIFKNYQEFESWLLSVLRSGVPSSSLSLKRIPIHVSASIMDLYRFTGGHQSHSIFRKSKLNNLFTSNKTTQTT